MKNIVIVITLLLNTLTFAGTAILAISNGANGKAVFLIVVLLVLSLTSTILSVLR